MLAPDKHGPRDLALLLVLLALVLFASPLLDFWARPGVPWFFPFAAWLVLIVLGGVIHYRTRRQEQRRDDP